MTAARLPRALLLLLLFLQMLLRCQSAKRQAAPDIEAHVAASTDDLSRLFALEKRLHAMATEYAAGGSATDRRAFGEFAEENLFGQAGACCCYMPLYTPLHASRSDLSHQGSVPRGGYF